MAVILLILAFACSLASFMAAGAYGATPSHKVTYLRRAAICWTVLSTASHTLAYLAGAA
jgi:putative Mn2+ efflux pump MntP